MAIDLVNNDILGQSKNSPGVFTLTPGSFKNA